MIKDQVIHCQHTQILITSCMVEGTASHQTEQKTFGFFQMELSASLSRDYFFFCTPIIQQLSNSYQVDLDSLIHYKDTHVIISKHNLKHQDQQSPNIHSLDEIKPVKLLFQVFVFIKIFHISDFNTTDTDTNSPAEKSKLLLADRIHLQWEIKTCMAKALNATSTHVKHCRNAQNVFLSLK